MANTPVVPVNPGPGDGGTVSRTLEIDVAGGPERTVKFNICVGPPVRLTVSVKLIVVGQGTLPARENWKGVVFVPVAPPDAILG